MKIGPPAGPNSLIVKRRKAYTPGLPRRFIPQRWPSAPPTPPQRRLPGKPPSNLPRFQNLTCDDFDEDLDLARSNFPLPGERPIGNVFVGLEDAAEEEGEGDEDRVDLNNIARGEPVYLLATKPAKPKRKKTGAGGGKARSSRTLTSVPENSELPDLHQASQSLASPGKGPGGEGRRLEEVADGAKRAEEESSWDGNGQRNADQDANGFSGGEGDEDWDMLSQASRQEGRAGRSWSCSTMATVDSNGEWVVVRDGMARNTFPT
ncbi:hypothetical protein ACRALDRAFT_1083633 [Sodiomyces alcalophilus JCM 7366]|uniref:uncharacterized protein n=1 Tax=Sodiomyces alcalophilus JCM 7366 TaxID=591952 RepID=UPI0039B6B1C9